MVPEKAAGRGRGFSEVDEAVGAEVAAVAVVVVAVAFEVLD
jgi:hypothetical protein